MRKLYPKAKYDIGEQTCVLVTASDAFVVLAFEEQEMVMPRDLFEQQAMFVRRFHAHFVNGIFGEGGVMKPLANALSDQPSRGDGYWCIDLDKVPEEAYVQGWNP